MSKNSTNVRIIKLWARWGTAVTPQLAARWLERLFLTPSRRPMPPREVDWMANAQRHRVRFDDARQLSLYSWETWGRGPTILLAHGWSGRGSQMAVFVKRLVEQGFRVVAFDAPGHGEAEGHLSGLPEMATAIERVADWAGPLEGIVAHSLGTAATTIALSRGLSVARLVYVAPPDNPGDYLHRVARRLGFGDEVARRARGRIERRFSLPFESARSTSLAPALDVPLLVIHDRSDREVPYREGIRLVKAWPGAELMTTNGLGHNRILGDPQVLDRTIRFLRANRESAWYGSFTTRPNRPVHVPSGL